MNDIEALAPRVEQGAQHLRRMLKIRIHRHDHVSVGVVEAGSERRLMAEVARQEKILKPLVRTVKLLENPSRFVPAAIVHEEHGPIHLERV
jgi:hypothetical protein